MVVSQSRVIKASILFDSFLFAYPSLVKLSWLIPCVQLNVGRPNQKQY